jgi:molybdate transport system ATP-binding protein
MRIQAQFEHRYGDFKLHIDVQLPAAGMSVIVGHSGSGKTTLLRCIAGLERASQGFLSVADDCWQDSQKNFFIPPYQRAVGYVFQEANLFEHLTVQGNLNYGFKRKLAMHSQISMDAIIELLGIEKLLTRFPENLSGGEKQRVAIARALATSPKVLLMDEPLAALDFKRKQTFLAFLSTLPTTLGIPIIYVTHSQQELAKLADYVLVMSAGHVLASGDLSTVLTATDLPIAQEAQQAFVVWQTHVIAHETAFHLTHVVFEGGRLSLPQLDLAIGDAVRVQIYARDVSISLTLPVQSSILNVLTAHIDSLLPSSNGQTLLQLRLGAEKLLAYISLKSTQQLNLQVGMYVYVQIKGTSVLN